MLKNAGYVLFHATMILSALMVQGCGKSSPQQTMDKAEKVVEAFLDSWSRGESPDKFADPGQPIQGHDPDWKAGYRLLSFLTVDSTQSQEIPIFSAAGWLSPYRIVGVGKWRKKSYTECK